VTVDVVRLMEADRRYRVLKRLLRDKRHVYLATRTSEVLSEVVLSSADGILETGVNLDNILDKLESRQPPTGDRSRPPDRCRNCGEKHWLNPDGLCLYCVGLKLKASLEAAPKAAPKAAPHFLLRWRSPVLGGYSLLCSCGFGVWDRVWNAAIAEFDAHLAAHGAAPTNPLWRPYLPGDLASDGGPHGVAGS
jgi:hypothetical protein